MATIYIIYEYIYGTGDGLWFLYYSSCRHGLVWNRFFSEILWLIIKLSIICGQDHNYIFYNSFIWLTLTHPRKMARDGKSLVSWLPIQSVDQVYLGTPSKGFPSRWAQWLTPSPQVMSCAAEKPTPDSLVLPSGIAFTDSPTLSSTTIPWWENATENHTVHGKFHQVPLPAIERVQWYDR